jgi:hypothetical protein
VGDAVCDGVSEIEGVAERVPDLDGVKVDDKVGVGDKVDDKVGVGDKVDDKVGVGDGEGQIGVICLMQWLLVSPMYRVPAEFTVIPKGALKRETVPEPSKKDPKESPAIVVTMPRGVIMRIRWLPRSATRRLPLDAKERWCG